MVHQIYSWCTEAGSKKLNRGSSTSYIHSSCNTPNFSFVNNNSILSKNCNTLSGYYQNVRGLKSKLSNVCLNSVSLNHFDYSTLTETWLTNDINKNELGMSNFTVFRNDRNN